MDDSVWVPTVFTKNRELFHRRPLLFGATGTTTILARRVVTARVEAMIAHQ